MDEFTFSESPMTQRVNELVLLSAAVNENHDGDVHELLLKAATHVCYLLLTQPSHLSGTLQ